MTQASNLNEAHFGWSDPAPEHVFTPLGSGPHVDQAVDGINLDRAAYPTRQAWRNHVDRELEAARGRGDHETEVVVRAELAKLGDVT